MEKNKSYRIFALIYEKSVYIGKTFSRRVSAVYQRHLRGEIKATRGFCRKGQKPKMYILHCGTMQAFEAYRHILAYIHVFAKAGFEVMNCTRSVKRSEDLHPETQKIVEQLEMETLGKILAKTLVKSIKDADDDPEPTEKEPTTQVADQKLTLRVTRIEKEGFSRIGRELELTQRETLQYLLAKKDQVDPVFLDWEGDKYLRALVNAYREENTKIKRKNTELQELLAKSRTDKQEKLAQKNERIRAIKHGIDQFFSMLKTTNKIPVEFEVGAYKCFPQANQYQYPEKAGPYVLRPHEILRGKGRWSALFVLGEGDDGRLYKFRWYPKDCFVGINICDRRYGKRSSVWLVGCEKANDEAMDVTYAFPLEVQFRYNGPEEYGSEVKRFVADLMKESEDY